MKKSRVLLTVFLAVWTIVLLCVASYSWIQRDWTPSLQHDRISISTTGSLVMILADDKDEVPVDSIDLSETIYHDFTFKQVSSSNAIDFFAGDFLQTPKYYSIAEKERCMTFTFYLKLQASGSGMEKEKGIYIHPDTWISTVDGTDSGDTGCASKALRIAISDGENTCFISRKGDTVAQDKGFTEVYAAGPDANGKLIYNDYENGDLTFNLEAAEKLKSYALNHYNKEDGKYLFKIKSSETKTLTVKIWLEGGDEVHCDDSISSDILSLMLKFEAKDIEQG